MRILLVVVVAVTSMACEAQPQFPLLAQTSRDAQLSTPTPRAIRDTLPLAKHVVRILCTA
jgi:hypothetical protein